MNIILNIFLIGVIILIGVILFFLMRFQIWKIKENKRGWRTRSLGRDTISYQEKIKGKWYEIEIDSEMLIGKISKALYFKTEDKWSEYPEWSKNRKEIIERMKTDYPLERTEYEND